MTRHDEAMMMKAIVQIEQVWREVRHGLFLRRDLGEPITDLPDIGEEAAMARGARARGILNDIDAIDATLLPGEIATTLAVARVVATRLAREGEWYWLVFDPLGVGFFAMFAPTAYCAGFLLNSIHAILAAHPFARVGDLDRYLALVEDYARLIDQIRERTEGQAARGIRMPVVQLDQSIELVARLSASAPAALAPSPDRLGAVGTEEGRRRIDQRISDRVVTAFANLAAFLADPAYRAAAPEGVGIAQYPGGAEVYSALIEQHTTLALTSAEIHAEGIRRIAAIRAEMGRLSEQAGLDGTPEAYAAAIDADPAWRAVDVDGVEAVFRRYIDRIAPHIDTQFNFKPRARHDVAALPAELSASMTFGYYEPPTADRPIGRYLFNAENLARNAMHNVAALNFHELVPGHHFHFASQRENDMLHPLRKNAFFNAFNEGWAEYAGKLAGEMGMYAAPEERFGRLVMDAFLTCRLVVDTGMNALGWSLEQARDYMRANAFMPETEIASESVRYSCDIPAQSLAYKLGEHFLVDLREAMRSALDDRFDIRDFHDAVLKPGALPLPMVAANVATATNELAAT
ncbi:DUF885 domain-containing protein [Sphingomonas sp.]|uniref:DUF885 domain-containing protein n=1 Tax=Sphingomonas sp. TaxID=28214 RepID=UPI003D6C7995